MNASSMILGLLCGLAIGYAFGWQERRRKLKLSGPAIRDCDGPMPCTTCPDKRECGRAGCIRPIPAANTVAPAGWFEFAGDLSRQVQLVVHLENVNLGTQWHAVSNHSGRIVVGQSDPYEALRLALLNAGAAPTGSAELEAAA